MGIYEAVNEALKDAMRAKAKERLSALRNIRAGFIEAMKLDNSDSLSDEACLAVLRKLAKQRSESLEAYRSGGREDLAAVEQEELEVIQAFLPKQAGEEVVKAWVAEVIAALGATGPKDAGKVTGAVLKAHRDEVDSRMVQALVRAALGG